MNDYLVIKNNVVVNTIVIENINNISLDPECEYVNYYKEQGAPGIGWLKIGPNEYQAPLIQDELEGE